MKKIFSELFISYSAQLGISPQELDNRIEKNNFLLENGLRIDENRLFNILEDDIVIVVDTNPKEISQQLGKKWFQSKKGEEPYGFVSLKFLQECPEFVKYADMINKC